MAAGLAIVGYGKMGHMIEALAPQHGFEVRVRLDIQDNADGAGLTTEKFRGVDVAIEFSSPTTAAENVRRLAALKVNTVVGTTGWYDELPSVRAAVEKSGAGVVYAPNFSVGVNLFQQIVAEAAKRFAARGEYEAWGWEMHHSQKKDAPSGTLLKLAETMRHSGYKHAIDLSSSRAGAVPGTHEIGFDSVADTITLKHTARSREGFADGALRAARWVIGKKGLFEFQEILGELA
ncbi:MAG: dihydrodipicolinate reductase C-terminal domain-containing protein [Candidatus Acidiferrales bacterium]